LTEVLQTVASLTNKVSTPLKSSGDNQAESPSLSSDVTFSIHQRLQHQLHELEGSANAETLDTLTALGPENADIDLDDTAPEH
jgi:hypothetical protein